MVLSVVAVTNDLSFEGGGAHIAHGPFDARLALEMGDAGRVFDEAAVLRVLQESVVEPGAGRAGSVHHSLDVCLR